MTRLGCLIWLVLVLDIQERTSHGGASILLNINYTTSTGWNDPLDKTANDPV